MVRTLKQLAKGLDELELHVVEESSDVVVRLDGRAGPLEADALDDIRVERSLKQPLDLSSLSSSVLELLLQPCGLLLEDLDEGVSDDLALLLGVEDTLELAKEQLRRVDHSEVDAEILAKHLVDLSGLVHAENTVVDHDGVEAVAKTTFSFLRTRSTKLKGSPVADSLVHELRCDRRVNSATDSSNDLSSRANELPDPRDLFVNKGILQRVLVSSQALSLSTQTERRTHHGPLALASADVHDEALQDLLSTRAVGNLGMELDAVDGPGVVSEGGERSGFGGGDDGEVLGKGVEAIRVRHPDLRVKLI